MTADEREEVRDRAAAGAFAAYVAIALPVIVFVLARHRWFLRDEWSFFSERDVSVDGLFEPHFYQHLVAVPVLVYRGMWAIFGANTYVPYQLLIAGMHLGVVVLLRALLRRVGVGPWLATVSAAILVLFGPGQEDMTWAFQITLTGPILFGLAQLLLADHDGPLGRRDGLALLCGLLGVLSSALGVTMVAVVGAALLIRHGWRSAALQAVPPAVLMVVWARTMHPVTFEGPDLSTALQWVGWTFSAGLEGLGHFGIVGAAMAVLTVVGMVLAVHDVPPASPGPLITRSRARIRPVAVPLAMAGGALLFTLLTARGRWTLGEEGARAGRYVYVMAVLLIPALATAAEAVARRWPRARPALVLLLLLPIPFNLEGFDDPVFSAEYFDAQRATLTTLVELPIAREVPPDTHPPGWNLTMGEGMTIGFLLDAHEAGRLPGAGTVPDAEAEELTIRIAVQQADASGPAPECDELDAEVEVQPDAGDTYVIRSPVRISLAASATDPPTRVRFDPAEGDALTFLAGGMSFVLAPPLSTGTLVLCGPAR